MSPAVDRRPTRVVNVKRESCTAYVGRAGPYLERYRRNVPDEAVERGRRHELANPFERGRRWGPLDAVDLFRAVFVARLEVDPEFEVFVRSLEGESLGCWCVAADGTGRCHATVVKDYLDRVARGNA